MIDKLPYPFNKAYENGNSIDYTVGSWSKETDHSYVEKAGYDPQMMPDCTYYAKGLPGFSLSSYGDWGTFYPDDATTEGKEMFLDMVDKDIIRLWRIRAYIKKDGEVITYDYELGVGWKKYYKKQWVKGEDPYED